MPSEKDKILQFNQYMKSNKIPYIIYADIESLSRKIDGCVNNPENSSTTKNMWVYCGYSMSTICAFDHIQNRHNLYRGEDCMKKFCEFLREHAKNIIDFGIKKMFLLTKKNKNHIKMQKYVTFVEKDS